MTVTRSSFLVILLSLLLLATFSQLPATLSAPGEHSFRIAEASTMPGSRLPGDLNAADASGPGNVWVVGGGDKAYQYDGARWLDRSWAPSFGDIRSLGGQVLNLEFPTI